MFIPALLAGLLLSGVGVGAQAVDTPQAGAPSTAVRTVAPPPVAPTTVAEAKPADADTVTCKYEASTGTRFPTRICHTKAQWDKMARDARDFINGNAGHFGCGKTTC